MSLWTEFRRRNVFKVAAAYLILAWLIAQVAGFFAPALYLPDWTVTLVAFLLILGFPLAIFFAWAFEVTPDGIRRTQEVVPKDSITPVTGRRLNYLVITLLAAAVIFLITDSYLLTDDNGELRSVAVLPFLNVTSDQQQETFADGFTDELITALIQIPELRVTNRTSSFVFKGSNQTVSEIAAVLNVDHILEGSLVREGDAVRVNARLVLVEDESSLWARIYDADFGDPLTIQKDIATEVARELGVDLELGEGAGLLGGTSNIDAYELFLAARAVQGFNVEAQMQRISLLDQAIDLDPTFALAYTTKSSMHSTLVQIVAGELVPAQQALAEQAARRAIAIEPTLAWAYAVLGYTLSQQQRWSEADQAYRRAESLAYGTTGNQAYGIMLMAAGRHAAAREIQRAAVELDPLNGVLRGFYAMSMLLDGDMQAAVEEIERGREVFDTWQFSNDFALAQITGDFDSSADIPPNPVADAIRADLDSPAAALATLRSMAAASTIQNELTQIALWAAKLGDAALSFDVMRRLVDQNSQNLFLFWYPVMTEVRQLPEFVELFRDVGMVSFWNDAGWPAACEPLGEDSFRCD